MKIVGPITHSQVIEQMEELNEQLNKRGMIFSIVRLYIWKADQKVELIKTLNLAISWDV